MSSGNVVDSKIVELAFNNQQFESNAKTSLSTLDKLKNALNFSGSSKNFEEMNKSLHKIDVKSLSSGVDTLRLSLNNLRNVVVFSWIADEAIKAKNAVEGFIKSVTTDQIAAGFGKYAEKTSAVQTIMSATASAYSDTEEQMADVNAQLEKLNWFTDETSFNFVDMVSNIGKFTSNNIGLEESVTSMQGISVWAAKSGATIEQASHAMYNLSQALATGSVKLMDWKSIENANMATAEFKQTAIDTAVELGTLTKVSDDLYKTLAGHEVSVSNFNAQLSDGWFTSKVLLQTLDNYGSFTNQLYETLEKTKDGFYTSNLLQLIDDYKNGSVDMNEAAKETGLSVSALKEELDKLSSEEMEFGLKAFKAAQEAKTFEEAVDSVKDAASTGWMNTFEIMFGDYLQAKELWTTLAEDLYEIFVEGGNARNELLKEAFGIQRNADISDWNLLKESGLASPEFISAVRKNAELHGVYAGQIGDDETWLTTVLNRGLLTMDDLNAAYEELYSGSSGEVDQALLEQVQSLQETDEGFKSLLDTIDKYNAEDLNKIEFGDGEYTEGLEELERSLDGIISSLGLTQDQGKDLVDVLLAIRNGGEGAAEKIINLSDEQIEALGYTEEVTEKIRELRDQGELTDQTLMDLINNEHLTGGELWTDALYNGMEALLGLFEMVKGAFYDIFPETTASTIYSIVEQLYYFSEHLINITTESGNLRSVFRGVFAIADIALRTVGAIAKIVSGSLTAVIETFGINIGDIAGKAGNAATAIHDWIVNNRVLETVVSTVTSGVRKGAEAVKNWVDSFLSIPIVQNNLKRFRRDFELVFRSIGPYFSKMPDQVAAFKKRLGEIGKIDFNNIGDVFTAFKETIWDYFINFPGFKTLSTAFKLLWKDIKGGLSSIGIDGEKIESTFIKVKDAVAGALGSIPEKAQAAYTKISGLWTQFKQMPVVQKNLTRFSNAFGYISSSAGTYFGKIPEKVDEFKKRISGLGTIDFSNIGETLTAFKETIWNYFVNFPGFKKLRTAFTDLWGDIKGGLSSVGIDGEALEANFLKVKDAVVGALGSIPAKAQAAYTKISGLWTQFKQMPIIQNNLKRFQTAFTSFGKKLPEFFGGFGEKFKEFKERIKGLDGISLDNIGKVFSSFKDTVLDYFANFDGFQGIKDAVGGLWDDVKAALLERGIDVDAMVAPFQKIGDRVWTALSNAFTNVTTFFKDAFADFDLTEFVTGLGDAINDFLDRISSLDDISLDNILKVFSSFKETVVNYFTNFEGFDGIKTAAQDLWNDIVAKFDGLGIDLEGFIERVKSFSEGVKDAFSAVLGLFSGKDGGESTEDAGNGLENFGNKISTAFKKIKVSLKGVNPKVMLALAGALAALFVVFRYSKSIVKIIKSYSDMLGAQTKELKARSLLEMAGAIGVLAFAMSLLAQLSVGQLFKAGIAIGALMAALVIMSAALDKFGADADKMTSAGLALIMIAGSLVILIIALKAMEFLDADKLDANMKRLGLALAAMVVALVVINKFGGNAFDGGKAILAIAAGLFIVALTLEKLATIPADRLGDAELALAIIGGVVTVMAVVLGLISKFLGGVKPSAIIALIVAAGSLYLLACAMQKLAGIPEGDLKRAEGALGIMVLCLGGILGLLALAGTGLGSKLIITGTLTLAAVLGIIALVGLIAGAIGGLIGLIPGGQGFILSGIDFIGQVIQKIADIVGGIVGGILDGITSFFESLPTLSDIGTEIKDFMDSIQGIKPVGIGGIIAFGEAIAAIAAIEFAGFLSALMEFVTGKSPIEQFSSDLQELANGMSEWDRVMKDIDSIQMPSGMGKLIATILAIDFEGLLGALFDGVSQLITGNSTMENFVEKLGLLSEGLVDWQKKMDEIDEITVPEDAIKSLVRSMNRIGWSELGNAIKEWIAGLFGKSGDPVQLFAEKLSTLASGLSDWQTKMEEVKHITVPTDAISDLIRMMDKISWHSLGDAIKGWIADLFSGGDDGEDPVTTFSEKLGKLGEALGTWQTKMEEIGAITVPSTVIDELITAMEKMPKEGGLINAMSGVFTGTVDFDDFKEKAGKLGEALGAFSTSLGEDFNVESIVGASTLVQAIADLGQALKGVQIDDNLISSGIFTQFGNALDDFGPKLSAFSKTDVDIDNLSVMAEASQSLASAARILSKFKITGDIVNDEKIASFKTGIETLKESIGSLSDLDTSGVDKLKEAAAGLSETDLTSAISNMQNATQGQTGATGSQVGSDMMSDVASGASEAAEALSSAMTSAVQGAADAVSDAGFGEKGKALVNAIKSGIEEGASGVIYAMQAVVSSAKVAADSASDGVSSAGLNFAIGFANGIRSGSYLGEAAAYAIGKAALRKLQQATEEKSPSKAAFRIGDYVGVGFTNGIDNNLTSSYRSGRGIARAAMGGLKEAAKTIKDILETDLDAQPVVRPVLDLSDIQSSAGSLSDMLNTSPIGITGNLSAINSNVNSRNMTSNADVVSAISQLRRTLNTGNLGTHNTYNVNGVTYDDGSNVADAVRALVHTTMVERRA